MPIGRTDRVARFLLPLLIAAVLGAGALAPNASRAFQVLVLAAMLASLGEAGSRLARWLAPELGRASHVVAAFSLAVGLAVLPATALGHLGRLRPAPFLLWTAAAFLLSRLLPVRPGVPPAAAETAEPPSRRLRVETALLAAALLAVAFAGLYDMRQLRYQPPGAHGFDDNSYHLSAVADWIRYGDLRMIRFSMGDPSTPFYPVLGELSSWVLIAPFRDSDVAARWTQLPFALFSFLAVFAIARRLGLARRDAAFAAVLYAAIHHVFPVLAVMAGNDHSTSFFALAGLDAALACARRPRAGTAALTGAALGLLLATKYIGLLFAPVVLAVLAVAVLTERRSADAAKPSYPRLAALALLLAAVLAVTGGYTYLRNAVTTGNPLFPAPMHLFGLDLPGWGGVSPAERAKAPEAQIQVWDFLTHRAKLFGSYFPFSLLPAALLAPLLALGRRRWLAALVFILPTVFFLQFLYLTPDHRDIRYFLPAIALAAVAFAWLLRALGDWTSYLRAALCLWITLQATRSVDWTAPEKTLLVVALLGGGALLEIAWRRWRERGSPRPQTWQAGLVAAALVLAAALPAGGMIATYQREKLAKQPGALALERLAGPGGDRVAYAGMNQPYLFFGSRLQNDLEIVPRTREVDSRYYSWGGELGDPYRAISYRRWRRSLEELDISRVVIVRGDWEDPERQWIVKRPDDFTLEYSDPAVEIWRLTRHPGQATGPR
jgi:uncharacterized membrane protein YsdA (DUF1294 family)